MSSISNGSLPTDIFIHRGIAIRCIKQEGYPDGYVASVCSGTMYQAGGKSGLIYDQIVRRTLEEMTGCIDRMLDRVRIVAGERRLLALEFAESDKGKESYRALLDRFIKESEQERGSR